MMWSTQYELHQLNEYVGHVNSLHETVCMQMKDLSSYIGCFQGVPNEHEYSLIRAYAQRMASNASNVHKGVSAISKYVDAYYQHSLPLKKRAIK